MTARQTTSAVPLVVLAVVVLALMGYLGWRVYDRPVDEHSAGRVAVRASDILVRAGGGDASFCSAMREVSAPDDADASVQRCEEVASRASSSGPGWFGSQGLQATDIDVGRQSGSVTVSGTLLTEGPAFPLSFTWPVERVDGAWTVSGGPDVKIG
jgi:hypothetical protein